MSKAARMRAAQPIPSVAHPAARVHDRKAQSPDRRAARGFDATLVPTLDGRAHDDRVSAVDSPHLLPTDGGQPLGAHTRAQMESRLGRDFSTVRVHSDTGAAAAAREFGAAAYTVADHIVFGSGRYRPETAPGSRLLAHELTHVVQASRIGGGRLALVSTPGDRAERDAAAVADSFDQRTSVPADFGWPTALIHRTPATETWYRGEAIGLAPSTPGGSVHDFGDGMYLTDLREVADQYADVRVRGTDLTRRTVSVEIAPQRLGRVLDLTTDARWQTYLESEPTPGVTVESLIRRANENYSRFFRNFLKLNNIRLEDFDTIKGPEFVRGGTQICIRNPQIQAQVRSAMIDIPLSASAPGSTGTSAASEVSASEAVATESSVVAAAAESSAETAAVAGEGLSAGAVAARIAVGLLETAVLVLVTLGLEYLKRQAEQAQLRRDLEKAQPKIASSVTALMPTARQLQRTSGGRTTWAIISIELRSMDTEMFSDWGFANLVQLFSGAAFLEPASLSLDYRRDRRTVRGERMRSMGQGVSSVSYEVRDIVTFSIPIAYDPASLEGEDRRERIRQNEADAAALDLSPPVLRVLFEERNALLRPPVGGRSMRPSPFPRR